MPRERRHLFGMMLDGAIAGEHRRRFGRGETIYDPWHYVRVLARKPGASRNGAPFKDWLLPASLGAYGVSCGAQTMATARRSGCCRRC